MILHRYVQAAALKGCAAAALGLTALFTLFDFVDQLSSVGHGHYRLRDAAVYVLLTAPYRLLQVAPVSVLLGCLLALGTFGRHAELTAIRSLGVSERRTLGAAMRLAVPIVVFLFLLAEFVIPPAQRLAQEGRASALSSLTTSRGADSFWAEDGNHYLDVQRFEDGNVPSDIDIFDFDGAGNLTTFLHARQAEIRPDGRWILSGVVRKQISHSAFSTEWFATLPWDSFMSAGLTRLLILPPSDMPPVALLRYVLHLRREHQQAVRYEQEIWEKISIPFSIVGMIMISAPFVFGPPRSRRAGSQLVAGACIGIVFSLVQQISSRLDLLLDLYPAVLAMAPSLLLMGVAGYLFLVLQR